MQPVYLHTQGGHRHGQTREHGGKRSLPLQRVSAFSFTLVGVSVVVSVNSCDDAIRCISVDRQVLHCRLRVVDLAEDLSSSNGAMPAFRAVDGDCVAI